MIIPNPHHLTAAEYRDGLLLKRGLSLIRAGASVCPYCRQDSGLGKASHNELK